MTDDSENKFQAVPHRRLAEEIADQIERLILNRELEIGGALPAERELAAQLGVSRNILREAISMLAQKGLLEVRSGSGTYVARPSVEFLRDTFDFFIRFNKSAMFDLVAARRCLEVEIAGLAAERATAQDCQHIAACLERMEQAVSDPEVYIEADVCFHEALAKAANNEILQLLLSSIRGALRENIRVLIEHHPTALDEAMRYHRRIAQTIQEQQPEAARLAMQEHIRSVGRGLRELGTQHDLFPSHENLERNGQWHQNHGTQPNGS
jgi:DNA-binding FadR family transcriptional regulator